MSGQLLSESRGGTLVLSLSNPEHRNALGPEIYAAGIEALNAAEGNADISCVVLRGDGGDFCAGGNLHRLQANRARAPSVQAESVDALHGWIETIRAFPKPVIAAVEGACAGAGFSLALACDLVVAARDAVFVMAYTTVGLSPDGGASWQLGRRLPRQLATQILMLGERLNAERMHGLGFVNHVSESGQALDDALTLAERLRARAPNALASVKELLSESDAAQLSAHLKREQEHFVANLHHDNAGEGIDAFLNRRKPRYR